MIIDKFVLVEITEYFNADGISYDSKRDDGAYGVSALPAEELPVSGEVVYIDNVPFIFPPKEDGLKNNIECFNQRIKLDGELYEVAYFLGSCDNGSFEERIKVVYGEENQVISNLSLSNWIATKPVFNEVEAFSCSHTHFADRDMDIRAFVWMQQIALDDTRGLEAIILPDNMCFHIMALTLLKKGC